MALLFNILKHIIEELATSKSPFSKQLVERTATPAEGLPPCFVHCVYWLHQKKILFWGWGVLFRNYKDCECFGNYERKGQRNKGMKEGRGEIAKQNF